MNESEKFYNRLSKKDQSLLDSLVLNLSERGLKYIGADIVKLSDNKYRLRKRSFRIIFQIDEYGKVEIIEIRPRNEKTYKKY